MPLKCAGQGLRRVSGADQVLDVRGIAMRKRVSGWPVASAREPTDHILRPPQHRTKDHLRVLAPNDDTIVLKALEDFAAHQWPTFVANILDGFGCHGNSIRIF